MGRLLCFGEVVESKGPVKNLLSKLEAGEAEEHAKRPSHRCQDVVEVIQDRLTCLLTQNRGDIYEE